MTSDQQARPRRRTPVWTAVTVLGLLILLLVVPPLVSIARYKSDVTRVVSAALRRPVRMSSVELRLLPTPGFVLTDLTVDEDPRYGTEPVLHAGTVRASIRLASLWRGKLQLSRISVDEASLNLVHTPDGRWNAEALFQTAAALPNNGSGNAAPFPYMEATNSRINVKNGAEKLPYSLVEADASLWLDNGAWRVRLRGQPARTDVSLDLPDTGIVRVDATLHPAARLEEMPLHLDLDWRDAQLGQLTRLVLGSDQGWRGDLTGELHLDGTPEMAKVTTRLRAAGVHRAEFAPPAPLDFDATCSFSYRGTAHGFQDVLCNSPVGDGRVRLTGSVPGDQPPALTLELDRVPAQASLDVLRTMRRNLDQSLQAAGSVSGKMSYGPHGAEDSEPATAAAGKNSAPAQASLAGSLLVEALRVTGANLSAPIQAPKVLFEAAANPAAPNQAAPNQAASNQADALFTTVNLLAGAPTPVTVTARMGLKGFQLSMRGPVSMPRLRDFARLAGVPAQGLADVTAAAATLDLTSEGQWLPAPTTLAALSAGKGVGADTPDDTGHVSGIILLRDATWKPPFLHNPVLLTSATLHAENGGVRWDPVVFTYGPVKGSATVTLPRACPADEECPLAFTAHFASLDAAGAQAALLGAHDSGTLLASVLARFKSAAASPWPAIKGTVQTDALLLGPFTFNNVDAEVKITPAGAEVSAFQARVLGGTVNATANLQTGQKPAYTVKGEFTHVSPALLGQLLGQRWSGGAIGGSGELTLAGYSDAELAASAKGTMQFDWRNGAVTTLGPDPAPPSLARFDRWSGQATIANGALTLGDNQATRGKRKQAVQATAAFGFPARVSFAGPPAPKPAH